LVWNVRSIQQIDHVKIGAFLSQLKQDSIRLQVQLSLLVRFSELLKHISHLDHFIEAAVASRLSLGSDLKLFFYLLFFLLLRLLHFLLIFCFQLELILIRKLLLLSHGDEVIESLELLKTIHVLH